MQGAPPQGGCSNVAWCWHARFPKKSIDHLNHLELTTHHSPLTHRPPRVSTLAANGAAESATCDYVMSDEEAKRGDHFNRFSSIAKVLLHMLLQRHP